MSSSNEPPGVRARFPELYSELREVAAWMLTRQRAQSISPTDLAHEAFVKLSLEEARRRSTQVSELGSKPNGVFKACFGAACRDVLVDRARARGARKRGGDRDREPLNPGIAIDGTSEFGVIDVHDAIEQLAVQDAELAAIVEARVFGELTVAECAEVLGVSTSTIDRRWAFARAWLEERLA